MCATSCCDASDLLDLTAVSFESLVDAARGCRDALAELAASSWIGPTHLPSMDPLVDHLRLPASSTPEIDFSDAQFWRAVALILWAPIFWNIVARLEHRRRYLTGVFFGRAKLALAFFALTIMLVGMARNHQFNVVCHSQPSWIFLRQNKFLISGYVSCGVGAMLVFLSFYHLGFFATFLGDYFGVFTHSSPVTKFPFSLTRDPMYWGSALIFFGLALIKSSPVGVLLAALVAASYKMALLFEAPFTTAIYEEKARREDRLESRTEDGDGKGTKSY